MPRLSRHETPQSKERGGWGGMPVVVYSRGIRLVSALPRPRDRGNRQEIYKKFMLAKKAEKCRRFSAVPTVSDTAVLLLLLLRVAGMACSLSAWRLSHAARGSLERTYLDVAVDDVRAVHVLEADEHLIQEQLDVLVREELRRPDQLVEVGVDELEHLRDEAQRGGGVREPDLSVGLGWEKEQEQT